MQPITDEEFESYIEQAKQSGFFIEGPPDPDGERTLIANKDAIRKYLNSLRREDSRLPTI